MSAETPSLVARAWLWLRDLWKAFLPCRFSVLVVFFGLAILLIVPQGQHVLYQLVEWGDNTWQQELHRILFFFIGVLVWALSAWYWSRIILSLDTWQTRDSLRKYLPRILGTVTMLGVAVALFKAAATYAVFDFKDERPVGRLVALGAITLLLTVLFFWFVTKRREWFRKTIRGFNRIVSGGKLDRLSTLFPEPQSVLDQYGRLPTPAKVYTCLFAGLSLALLVLLTTKTLAVADYLGPVPLLLVSFASWILFGTLLVHLARAKKIPLVTFLLLIAFIFSFWNDNHAIRLAQKKSQDSAIQKQAKTADTSDRELLGRRFKKWYSGKEGKPIFLVAAEGGGIRAAYWTASVLAAIQDENPEFARHVFAISGVSGGSLGGAVFAALVAESRERGDEKLACGTFLECTRGILGRDFLSPALGMLLGPDLVQRFLPFGVERFDRSLGLERAWESAWQQETGSRRFAGPFLDLWRGAKGREVPSLILNGTHVETGRRILTSNLSPTRTEGESPEFHDAYHLHDILNADLPLSSAAHNSARFTYVSPAGSLVADVKGKKVMRGHVVDGGYFENSGSTTVLEVLNVLETLCELETGDRLGFLQLGLSSRQEAPSCRGNFHVLYLLNDPKSAPDYRVREDDPTFDAPPDTGLAETMSPIRALMRTRSARGSYAVKSLKAAVGQQNFRHFSLCEEILVGDEMEKVPLPLGWQLSDNAKQAMDRQLEQPCTKVLGNAEIPVNNATTIKEVLGLL